MLLVPFNHVLPLHSITHVFILESTNSFAINTSEYYHCKEHRYMIYEIASQFNHFCQTIATRGFTKDLNISIRAIRNIEKGEGITLDLQRFLDGQEPV